MKNVEYGIVSSAEICNDPASVSEHLSFMREQKKMAMRATLKKIAAIRNYHNEGYRD